MTETSGRPAAPEVVVTDQPDRGRYEATVDGELAGFANYLRHGERIVFTHAEVYPRWEGRGVGGVLARGALDDVIAQGKQITPLCPFINAYVTRHPSYLEHVDVPHRTAIQAELDQQSASSG